MRENGATEEEIDFLCAAGYEDRYFLGKRVELNALGSDEFIAWIESKFEEHGVKKVIPSDPETLKATYRRAVQISDIQRIVDRLAGRDYSKVAVPDDLAERIANHLKADNTIPWDEAVSVIAKRTRGK